MRIRPVLFAMAALVMGSEALADNSVRYTYLQADALLSQLSAHRSAMHGSGLGVEGGVGIGPYLYASGSYGSNKYSEKTYDVQTNTHTKFRFSPTSLGAGGHVPVFASFDLVLGGTLERLELKTSVTGSPPAHETFKGWGALLGLRGWFSDTIQWDIALKRSRIGDLRTVLGYSFSGRYYFKAASSFGVDIHGRMYDDRALGVNESVVGIVFRHDFGVRY